MHFSKEFQICAMHNAIRVKLAESRHHRAKWVKRVASNEVIFRKYSASHLEFASCLSTMLSASNPRFQTTCECWVLDGNLRLFVFTMHGKKLKSHRPYFWVADFFNIQKKIEHQGLLVFFEHPAFLFACTEFFQHLDTRWFLSTRCFFFTPKVFSASQNIKSLSLTAIPLTLKLPSHRTF